MIFPNAQILGQAVKDIDIVVLGELHNYAPSLRYYEEGEALNFSVDSIISINTT